MRFRSAVSVVGAFLSIMVLSLGAQAWGADTYWQHDPATPGDWFDPLNWSLGAIPTDNDFVYIDNIGTAAVDSVDALANQMYLGHLTGHSGALTQTGGSTKVSTGLYLGYGAGSTGTYELGGTGTLESPKLYVGYQGAGTFTQSDGDYRGDDLYVGYYAGSEGTYVQTGGDCRARTGNPFTVYLGLNADSAGTYDMSGGYLSARYEYIGGSGIGTFNQSGGWNDAWDQLYISGPSDAVSTYTLSGTGLLESSSEFIGTDTGQGAFVQSGGTNRGGWLRIKGASESPSTYELSGTGQVTMQAEVIGAAGTVQFLQSGGTNTASWFIRVGHSGTASYTQTAGSTSAGSLDLGYQEDGNGTYRLEGTGVLMAGEETIGYDGTGTFIQTGGSNTVSGDLYVGNQPGSHGSYGLSGTGRLDAGMITVSGTSTFDQSGGGVTAKGLKVDTGGTYSFSGGTLELGRGFACPGTFDFNGQALTLSLPVSGIIDLTNPSGILNSSEASLVAGPNTLISYDPASPPESLLKSVTSTGFVQTRGSSFTIPADRAVIGWGALDGHVEVRGILDGSDGSIDLIGGLSVGTSAAALLGKGTLTINDFSGMSGGELSCGSEHIGDAGDGHFVQSDGNHSISHGLYVGGDSGSSGTFELSGGQLSCGSESIGYAGDGHFVQSDGNHSISYGLYVGGDSGSSGTFELSGGQLSCTDERVGRHGDGRFTQSGGANIVSDELLIGTQFDGNGSYSISKGSLSVSSLKVNVLHLYHDGSGLLEIDGADAHITVRDTLAFGSSGAYLSAVPGSVIHMTGSAFENQSKTESNLAGLSNLTLIYDDQTEGTVDPFEVAGVDRGRHPAGFVNNFALGGIELHEQAFLQLVDSRYNGNTFGVGGTAEALYLSSLTLQSGSTMDLNSLHLYVADLEDLGGTIKWGELISLIPGDADGNWRVDSADLAIWQRNYDPLGNNANTFDQGDWDGNGHIDSADLALWQRNYHPLYMGPGSALSSPEVTPEPATLLLVGPGLLTLVGLTRRRGMK